MCQILLHARADVNSAPSERQYSTSTRCVMALGAAVESKNHSLVTFMLHHGADVHDGRGDRMALEVAVALGDIKAVQLLLLAGADPSQDSSLAEACGLQNIQLI